MSGTSRATARDAPSRSACAATFGRYPSSRAQRRTRSWVASDTRPSAFPESTSETVDCETPAQRATSLLVWRCRSEGVMDGNSTTRRIPGLTDRRVIRTMSIRMTGLVTSIGTALAAGALALVGAIDSDQDRRSHGTGGADSVPTALVIDAARGRAGRELVDPRLRDLDADVRLPRTSAEARTNVRYFDALGYRVVVAGPTARAAAQATGVDGVRAAGLPQALEAAAR